MNEKSLNVKVNDSTCKYCKEFIEEITRTYQKQKISIVEICVGYDGYYKYECPINYCPNCGKLLPFTGR